MEPLFNLGKAMNVFLFRQAGPLDHPARMDSMEPLTGFSPTMARPYQTVLTFPPGPK